MNKLLIVTAATAILTAACDDSGTTAPEEQAAGTVTVNASQGWAYVAFQDGEAVGVSVTEPTTSADWDIAFNATRVMLNGGAAGPGGVAGYCICQNAGASDAQVMAMTPAGELADFEQVASAELPAGASWMSDELTAAIEGWYSYNPTTHAIAPATDNVFVVRTAAGTGFAKLRVIDIANATQAHAGDVSIEYAYQSAVGAAFSATDTVVLNADAGERLDLATGTVSTTGDWDLQLDGWMISLNGGVSGTGSAGAYLSEESFDEIVDASTAPSGAFSSDSFAGVFSESPWYRYNLDGQHTIFPTFDVYLVDTADGVYKIQVIGYYSQTGETRRITFRYELLD